MSFMINGQYLPHHVSNDWNISYKFSHIFEDLY